MPTNIGSLPIRPTPLVIVTRSNADWRDVFPFMIAGPVEVMATAANIGTGELTVASVDPRTPRGAHVLRVSQVEAGLPTRYTVHAPDGTLTCLGAVGLPFYAGGLTLSLLGGQVPFKEGDSFAISVQPQPVDVTGIRFDLMLRTEPGKARVMLYATSAPEALPIGAAYNGLILNGGATGGAGIFVQQAEMLKLPSGTYSYDLLAHADGQKVVPYFGTLAHDLGITDPPEILG